MPSSDPRTARVGRGFTFKVKASGYPAAGMTETGALPNGVTFTDSLAGTAATGTAGTYPLAITAFNRVGNPVSQHPV
jgi:Putative Ig domain